MNLFFEWGVLLNVAVVCLFEDDRYCILLDTPWAYTLEAALVFICLMVAGFAYLAGKYKKKLEAENEELSKRL